MDSITRIKYAIERITGTSVIILELSEWEKIIKEDGEPTKLSNVPSTISSLTSTKSHLWTIGSGIINSNPGIDEIRHDDAKEPIKFKIYHYSVLERFSSPRCIEMP